MKKLELPVRFELTCLKEDPDYKSGAIDHYAKEASTL